jgi:uroporphyrinogen III methyltransferase/synthase
MRNNTTSKIGKVYLVGAGPGDPDLLTIKGRECIGKADVLIYDYLASTTLLRHAGSKAEMIYVGKKGGDHTLSQDGINALLVEKARKGYIVTRLKGGDPFVFGRGGEEAEVLIDNEIPFEIVPGVTSAIAAPAYAGIPLTHRDYTATVAFVTGHEDPTKKKSKIDWPSLAQGIGTLVFFMGVKNLPNIRKKLLENGKPKDTPVALVRWGTTSRQKTVTGTLESILKEVKKAGLKAPAIILVGDVVRLRERMQWFEKRPLLGKRIVVTRARQQASELVDRLGQLGAECIECPTIEVAPPDDWTPLDRAIDNIEAYDWLVFTSVNGVQFFFRRLFAKDKDVRALHRIRTASIGPATSQRLLDFGIRSDIIPKTYRAESIIEAFSKQVMQDRRVLLPRASKARPILPQELARMGAMVDEIHAYQTLTVDEGRNDLIRALESGKIDMVTFTSSSTATNFKALLPQEHFPALVDNVSIAAIGPITADTAKSLGFSVDLVASKYTIEGLCDAIVSFIGRS